MPKKTTRRDYTVRESQRAKRVILKVSRGGDLEVVVPKGFSKRRLPGILRANETWIAKQLRLVDESTPVLAAPEHIDLKAIDERWQIEYRSTSDDRLSLSERASNWLLIEGDVGDTRRIASLLNRWLHLKAHAHLVPRLKDTSVELGVPFNRAMVRGQTTRWGSCSKFQNISLNRSLLFLPEHLVRHVLLHELCHIKQLDHSRDFWQLLEGIAPEYKRLEAEVRKANHYVPMWVNGNKPR